MISKDPTIVQLISILDLETRGWKIVDHWEADTCAIGIARANDLRRIVYISTFKKEAGRYDYECEFPAGQRKTDYDVTDRGVDVCYEQLLKVLQKHLT
jgi:hypothetical protein